MYTLGQKSLMQFLNFSYFSQSLDWLVDYLQFTELSDSVPEECSAQFKLH